MHKFLRPTVESMCCPHYLLSSFTDDDNDDHKQVDDNDDQSNVDDNDDSTVCVL